MRSAAAAVLYTSKQASRRQCPINAGAIDAAALGPFAKQAHGLHGRENEKSLLCFGCDFSAVGTISGKSLQLFPPDVIQ